MIKSRVWFFGAKVHIYPISCKQAMMCGLMWNRTVTVLRYNAVGLELPKWAHRQQACTGMGFAQVDTVQCSLCRSDLPHVQIDNYVIKHKTHYYVFFFFN